MDLNKIKQGDLFELLRVLSDEELDPIVSVIWKQLNISSDFKKMHKKYSPNHSKYCREIGEELLSFGGYTIENTVGMAKSWLPSWLTPKGTQYDDVVTAVCKKLSVPVSTQGILENEKNILDVYLKKTFEELSDEDKKDAMNKAKEEAKKESVSYTLELAKILLPRLALGPIGWILIPATFSGPAYRVIIPCVIHLAYLRKKIIDAEESKLSPSLTSVNSGGALVKKGFAIGESSENPILQFNSIDQFSAAEWHDVSTDSEIGRLNQVIQAVPGMVVAQEAASKQYMEVIINGPLAQAKNGDGFRAFTIDSQGISEHAILKNPTELTNVVNAAAVWQVASVVVAQKHLADINKQLEKIKIDIADIKDFLESERKSKIVGSIDYFRQISDSIYQGKNLDGYRTMLESHEEKLIDVQKHLAEQIGKLMKKSHKSEDMFGSEGDFSSLDKYLSEVEEKVQLYFMCIFARTTGLQLRMAFPDDDPIKINRRVAIENDVSILGKPELIEFHDRIVDQAKKIRSRVNTEKKLKTRKLNLIRKNAAVYEKLVLIHERLFQNIKNAEQVFGEEEKPVKLLVQVENGQIIDYAIPQQSMA